MHCSCASIRGNRSFDCCSTVEMVASTQFHTRKYLQSTIFFFPIYIWIMSVDSTTFFAVYSIAKTSPTTFGGLAIQLKYSTIDSGDFFGIFIRRCRARGSSMTSVQLVSRRHASSFAKRSPPGTTKGASKIVAQLVDLGTCTVEAHLMNHGTPSLAYVVREKAKLNIDVSRLAAFGLRPGPWLQKLKENAEGSDQLVIDGVTHSRTTLRESLVAETPGDSIAYLTDFILDEPAFAHLSKTLQGCGTVICEAQYRNADRDLALRNFHMTTGPVAELARQSAINRLVLFHLSDRYTSTEWKRCLPKRVQYFQTHPFRKRGASHRVPNLLLR